MNCSHDCNSCPPTDMDGKCMTTDSVKQNMMGRLGFIVLAVTAVNVLFIWLSWMMIPVRAGDAFCFMPTVVNFANNKGLINFGYAESDPQAIGRLVWHGYLSSVIY